MRLTILVGVAPAASVRGPSRLGRIVRPPPIDLLGPQHLGVCFHVRTERHLALQVGLAVNA
jgi:hypothetical protein